MESPITEDIEIIDGHAHPCVELPDVGPGDVLRSFTESDNDEYIATHGAHTVAAVAGIDYLASRLGTRRSANDIATVRKNQGLQPYARAVLSGHRIRGLLLDTGYPANGLSIAESEQMFAVPCREVRRVERVAETLFARARSARQLLGLLADALYGVDRDQVVAFKSIAAYRGGLRLGRPTSAELGAAFDNERRSAERRGRVRLSEPALIAAIAYKAFEVAQALGMPMQLHTGFGDRDLSLPESDPWHLKPILDADEFNRVPVVLLHASYPYVRQAGILAGLYHRVHVDTSLVCLTAHGGYRVVLQLLEQAPISKLTYGSDASVGPELIGFGAEVAKRAVVKAFGELIAETWLDSDLARDWAERLFAGNARALYGLDGVM